MFAAFWRRCRRGFTLKSPPFRPMTLPSRPLFSEQGEGHPVQPGHLYANQHLPALRMPPFFALHDGPPQRCGSNSRKATRSRQMNNRMEERQEG